MWIRKAWKEKGILGRVNAKDDSCDHFGAKSANHHFGSAARARWCERGAHENTHMRFSHFPFFHPRVLTWFVRNHGLKRRQLKLALWLVVRVRSSVFRDWTWENPCTRQFCRRRLRRFFGVDWTEGRIRRRWGRGSGAKMGTLDSYGIPIICRWFHMIGWGRGNDCLVVPLH